MSNSILVHSMQKTWKPEVFRDLLDSLATYKEEQKKVTVTTKRLNEKFDLRLTVNDVSSVYRACLDGRSWTKDPPFAEFAERIIAAVRAEKEQETAEEPVQVSQPVQPVAAPVQRTQQSRIAQASGFNGEAFGNSVVFQTQGQQNQLISVWAETTDVVRMLTQRPVVSVGRNAIIGCHEFSERKCTEKRLELKINWFPSFKGGIGECAAHTFIGFIFHYAGIDLDLLTQPNFEIKPGDDGFDFWANGLRIQNRCRTPKRNQPNDDDPSKYDVWLHGDFIRYEGVTRENVYKFSKIEVMFDSWKLSGGRLNTDFDELIPILQKGKNQGNE